MTDVRHETFALTRHLDVPPALVFAAFADDDLRRRWFKMPGSDATYRHEFHVGGGEEASSAFVSLDEPPQRLRYRSRYLDIVPDRRIVFGYESVVDDVLRWTSLVTVAISEDAGGSLLSWTEQVTFVTPTGDGSADLPHLRGATGLRLNGLAAALTPNGPRSE